MLRIQRLRSVGTRNRSVGVSGFSGFVPSAPAGAAFAAAVHPNYCRSDAGNTTPCVPGSKIQWWYDLISQTWFQQSTSANRYTMQRDNSSGKYYAVSGSTVFHQFGWVVDPSVNTRTYTIGAGVTGLDTISGSFGPFFDCSNGTNGYAWGCGVALHLQDPSFCFLINYSASNAPGVQALANGRTITETTTGAANMLLNAYYNSSNIMTIPTALLPLTNSNPINIGACSVKAAANRSLTTGNVWGVVGYTSVSSGTRAAADAWLQSIMP